MPKPDSHNPFLELMDVASRIDPGALVTLWANLPPHPPGFTGDLFERFDDIDGDGDGFISREELDEACGARRFRSHQAAAIATLRRILFELSDTPDDEEVALEADGVTRADLAGLDLAAAADPEEPLVVRVEGRYRQAKRKIAHSPRTVFVDEGNPSVDPMTCRQGIMGDCFFLAPLMALAFQDPNRLLSMIRRHPEASGAWRIYFRGASDAITVMTPTDAEIALFASADGLWPIVFEKACGIHLHGKPYATLTVALDDVNGGDNEAAVALLTGSDVDVDDLGVTRTSTTRAKLIEALGACKVVTAATVRRSSGSDETDDGMPRSHVYSVLSFDATSDTVYLRNPWGTDAGGPRGAEVSDGCFKLSLEALELNFRKIVYEC